MIVKIILDQNKITLRQFFVFFNVKLFQFQKEIIFKYNYIRMRIVTIRMSPQNHYYSKWILLVASDAILDSNNQFLRFSSKYFNQ
jgi:hypothetical protein